MKKKFSFLDFEAEYEITGSVGGNERTLKVTFANIGMETQKFEVAGGNIELPGFWLLMQEAMPLAIGRQLSMERDDD